MKNNKSTETDQKGKPKKSILRAFFGKKEPDKAYMSDLRYEWQNMIQKDRVKFVLGAVFGLIIFIFALIMVYIVLSRMMR